MLPQEVRWPLLHKAMALSERTRQNNTGQWFSSVCSQWKNEIKNSSYFRRMFARFVECLWTLLFTLLAKYYLKIIPDQINNNLITLEFYGWFSPKRSIGTALYLSKPRSGWKRKHISPGSSYQGNIIVGGEHGRSSSGARGAKPPRLTILLGARGV